MEQLRKLLTCKKCMHFLQDPIRLHCNTICSMHLNELKDKHIPNRINCDLCGKYHEIPSTGFEKDEELHTIILNEEHLNEQEKNFNGNMEIKIEKLNDNFKNLKENYDSVKSYYDNINIIKLNIEKYFSDNIQKIERIKIGDMENEINQLITCWGFEKNSLEFEAKSDCQLRTEKLLSEIKDDLKNIRTFPELFKNFKKVIDKFEINEKGKGKLN